MVSKNLKIKYVAALAAFSCVVGCLGLWLFRSFYPEAYFPVYPAIPVYFFLIGMLSLLLYRPGRQGKSTVITYIGIRMIKLLTSVLLLLLYAFLVRAQIITVLVTFCIYYIAYMIFEATFLFLSERKTISPKNSACNETY